MKLFFLNLLISIAFFSLTNTAFSESFYHEELSLEGDIEKAIVTPQSVCIDHPKYSEIKSGLVKHKEENIIKGGVVANLCNNNHHTLALRVIGKGMNPNGEMEVKIDRYKNSSSSCEITYVKNLANRIHGECFTKGGKSVVRMTNVRN